MVPEEPARPEVVEAPPAPKDLEVARKAVGAFEEAVPSGGDRLVLRGKDELRVLQVPSLEVTARIRLPEVLTPNAFSVAAGAEHVVFYNDVDRRLWIYQLDGTPVTRTQGGYPKIQALAMGAGARRGEVLALSQERAEVLTLETPWSPGGWKAAVPPGTSQLSASHDGSTFVAFDRVGARGLTVIRFSATGPVVSSREQLPRRRGQSEPLWAVPSWDGRYIFTSWGVFDADLAEVKEDDVPLPNLLPARDRPLALVYVPEDSRMRHASVVHVGPTRRALRGWDMAKLLGADADLGAARVDQRVHLFAAHELLVVVPARRPEDLAMVRVDLSSKLAEERRAGRGFLLPTHLLPSHATVGRYEVALGAQASGAVRFALERGPDGMVVEGDRLTWEVPEALRGTSVDVALAVIREDGERALQEVQIHVR